MDEYFDDRNRLSIGLGERLQLELEGVATRLWSELVGMKPGEYLIIGEPPKSNLIKNLGLDKGTPLSGILKTSQAPRVPVTVRLIQDGVALAFVTHIIGAIHYPAKLIFMDCPRIVSERSFRAHRRFKKSLPATMTIGERQLPGLIIDLSKAGCQFATKMAAPDLAGDSLFARDQAVHVIFHLPGVATELSIPGKQKNFRPDQPSVVFGIEFTDSDEEMRALLHDYLDRLMPHV